VAAHAKETATTTIANPEKTKANDDCDDNDVVDDDDDDDDDDNPCQLYLAQSTIPNGE
jgi:hypothetical protein